MKERATCLSFPLGMMLLLSSLAFGQAREWFSFNYQEQEWYINTTALTVSSITYNPSSTYSDWVPRLFGEHAIFHNRTFAKKAGASLSPEEKSDRSRIFRDHFQLPPEAILPSCSFEMMGYAMVDYDHPISHYYMNTAPSIGMGTLSFLNGNAKTPDQQPTDVWKCYYRTMYEYSAKKLLLLPVVHWPVFIYCPAPRHDQSCLNIHEWYKRTMIERVMEVNVSSSTENLAQRLQFTDPLFNDFPLYQQLIQATIGSMTLPARLDIHLMHGKWTTNMDLDLMNIVRKPKSHERAVCAVIPYTATDPGRRDINDGMTFDFIRYYNRLGFKVVIYDRDGINYNNIMHGPYSQLQGDDPRQFDLLYYNFTVLQRLIPGIGKFEADNVDSIKLSKVVVRGDIDKRLTYTYCRTHLRQTYGIEDVMIVDFDEFLFCPRGAATAEGQRQYLDEYFQHMRDQGIEQLFVKQRVLVPATPSNNMTDCLLAQVSQAATMHAALTQQSRTSKKQKTAAESVPSIFNCLAPFHYGVKMFFDKAVHFGHACPYTSFHFSAYLRFVDCYVNSFQSSSRVKRHYHLGGCSLIHITSRPNHYNRSHPFTSQEVMQRPNELVHILREPWTNPTPTAATKQPVIDKRLSSHRLRVHNSGHNLHHVVTDQSQQHQMARSLVTHV